MYNVLEVAQHVINKSIEIERPVTNLKLQKLLYYIQAAFLVTYKKPCFDKEIENWRHGPVVPEVYSEYRVYTNKPITDLQNESIEMYINSNYSLAVRRIEYDEENFKYEDLKLIDKVIYSYKDIKPWVIVDKTHEEDPWKNTNQDEVISKEAILDYFKDRAERIYGGIDEAITI